MILQRRHARSNQIVQFKNESDFAVCLERLVQLEQVRMSKVVSDIDLAANHRSLNGRARHELGRPVSAGRTLNRTMYHAERASANTTQYVNIISFSFIRVIVLLRLSFFFLCLFCFLYTYFIHHYGSTKKTSKFTTKG